MGGSSSEDTDIKTVIKKKVESELSTEISKSNEIATKFMNKITTSITSKKVQSLKSQINANADASNIIRGLNIVAKKGSKVDIDMTSEAAAEIKAIAELLSTTKDDFNFANAIKTQTDNAIKSDNEMKAALKQSAELASEQQSAGGGFGDMVDSITSMAEGIFNNLTGGDETKTTKSSTEIETKVKSKVKAKIEERNKIDINATSDFTNDIVSTVTSNVDSLCAAGPSARNEMIDNKYQAIEGSMITIRMDASVNATAECITSAILDNSVIGKLKNDAINSGVIDSDTKNKSDSDSDQDAKIKDEKKENDALSDLLSKVSGDIKDVTNKGIDTAGGVAQSGMTMLLLPMIIIGGGVALFIVFKMFSGNKNQGNNNSFDDVSDGYDYAGGAIGGMELKRAIVMIGFFVVLDQVLKRIYK